LTSNITGLQLGTPVNATGPVGVPEPGAFGATVAVKLTDWPAADGLAEEDTDVVVSAWLTSWGRGGFDVLKRKSEEPE
jgi:hypothetical protein